MWWLMVLVLLLSSCASLLGAPTPAEILADEFVTDAEYTAAVEAVGDCVEASGADFSVEYDEHNIASFQASGRDDVETIMDGCLARHLGRVDLVWAEQHAPTVEEEAAFYDAVVSCVEDGLGVEFGTVTAKSSGKGPDTSVTDAAIAADFDLYLECLDLQVAREGG